MKETVNTFRMGAQVFAERLSVLINASNAFLERARVSLHEDGILDPHQILILAAQGCLQSCIELSLWVQHQAKIREFKTVRGDESV